MAASDPLAFFSLADMMCRQDPSPPDLVLVGRQLLVIPGLLSGATNRQLLPTWQHYKAFASAFASWMKAYVKLLPGAVAAAQAGDGEGVSALTDTLNMISTWLRVESPSTSALRMREFRSVADVLVNYWDSAPRRTQAETLRSFRLVLLMLLTRAVLAIVQHMGVGEGTYNSSSSGRTDPTATAVARTSASSSSRTMPGGRSSRGSNNSSSSMRGSIRVNIGDYNSHRTWDLAAGWLKYPDYGASALARVASLAHANLLAIREKVVGGEGKVGSDSSAAAAAAASSKARVPKRLSALPELGVPAPVGEQVIDLDRAWRSSAFADGGKDQEQLLLQKIVECFSLVLGEVPLPVGCSYPACVNLEGTSEVAAANRRCSGCRAVYYCSRQCQKLHWGQHQGLCRRMQQQRKEEEEEGEQQQERGAEE